MKKYVILFIALAAINLKARAQEDFKLPLDYRFETKADYKMYEPEIISFTDWLQRSSYDYQPDKRRRSRLFFLSWVQGQSTDVVPVVGKTVNELSDKNQELIYTYLSQYAKYALQHKDNKDKNKANYVALKALIEKYQMEPTHKKDEDVEKLIQVERDGNLQNWIAVNFK